MVAFGLKECPHHLMVPRQGNAMLKGQLLSFGFNLIIAQPRPQGLLAFQYGGGRREDPGTQQKSWALSI